jgi:hypothetical protein
MPSRYSWYWIVGGSTTEVYSSAARAYVAVDNGAYVAWLQSGGTPTKIDTDANLKVVLFNEGALTLDVSSTATPSLNGNYSVTSESQASINGVATYILLNNKFPGNADTMPWMDADGGQHLFPDVGTFKNFATAYADFLAAVLVFINSGGTIGSIPSNQVTIP